MVMDMFAGKLHAKVVRVNAADLFLGQLAGVTDPEKKRKIIGGLFVDVANRNDAPVTNANVGAESFTAGSVDNGSAFDQKIEHLSPPPVGQRGLRTFPILPPINGQRKRQIRRR
jgi:hypothetical protein